jgi:hypothetical protein
VEGALILEEDRDGEATDSDNCLDGARAGIGSGTNDRRLDSDSDLAERRYSNGSAERTECNSGARHAVDFVSRSQAGVVSVSSYDIGGGWIAAATG